MLTVITGPMFSGKTSRLLSILDAYYHAGRTSCIFKPANDYRYGYDAVKTHFGRKRAAFPIPTKEPLKIMELSRSLSSVKKGDEFVPASVFGIDEAQFFEPKGLISAVETMLYWRDNEQVDIVISGLSQDSDGKPFGAMPHLLAIADDIVHLKSVCAKTKQIGAGTRTFRKDKSDNSQVLVGGVELYEPRSFNAWIEGNDSNT